MTSVGTLRVTAVQRLREQLLSEKTVLPLTLNTLGGSLMGGITVNNPDGTKVVFKHTMALLQILQVKFLQTAVSSFLVT